jgi:chromosome partitioning protein
MRRIAVVMFKGGTGKSTVATTVAVGLARRGRKVTLIDLDAQGNATDMLGCSDHGTTGVYKVIVEGAEPSEIAVEVEPNLTLLPSSRALAPVDSWLTMQTRREELLKRRLAHYNGQDFVFMDTGPSFSLLNLNALTYAGELWLPVSMDYLSLAGAAQMLDTLRMVGEEIGHQVAVSKVIPTFYDRRTKKSQAVLEALQETFGDAVTPPIRTNVRLSEAPSHHRSIFDYAPGSPGAEDFERLLDHLEN